LQIILPTTVISELIEEIASDGCSVAAGCVPDRCSDGTRAALQFSPTDLPFPNMPFSDAWFSGSSGHKDGDDVWLLLVRSCAHLCLLRASPENGVARMGSFGGQTGALIFLRQISYRVFDRDQSETIPLCRIFYSGEGLL
jgi:hypothetical protein